MTDGQMDEIKRHFNVVAETILHEVRLIAEGHGMLNDKIVRMQTRSQEQHAKAMAMMKTMHNSLDARTDSVRSELKEELRVVGEKRSDMELASLR